MNDSAHSENKVPFWLKVGWLVALAGVIGYITYNLLHKPF